jgi:hypothetical protein
MPGFNKVSSVGIGATGTMTRPANTNTYTAGDVVGTAVAVTSIIGPIVTFQGDLNTDFNFIVVYI